MVLYSSPFLLVATFTREALDCISGTGEDYIRLRRSCLFDLFLLKAYAIIFEERLNGGSSDLAGEEHATTK